MSTLFVTVTWLGSIIILLPVSLAVSTWLFLRGRRDDSLLLWIGLAGASALAHLLKLLFARPRPPVTDLLVAMPQSYAFPSAHTAQAVAFALACTLIFYDKPMGSAKFYLFSFLWGVTLLVALSRVYLKVHYLSDVAGGAVLAIVWVVFVYRLLAIWFRKSRSGLS